MIIEVGLMFATYFGVKYIEKLKGNKKSKKTQTPVKPEVQSKAIQQRKKEQIQKKDQHYFNVALVSMGLAALRIFSLPAIGLISLGTYIYTMIPNMKDVEKAIVKERKVNVDVLFFVGDVLALSINNYFAAALGAWIMISGKISVKKAKDDSNKIITNIFEQLPQKVWIVRGGVEVEIPLEEVNIDDIVVLNTGEVIPVDGVITEGMATIDQHALTGEARPTEKEVGDVVFASTVIITGRIQIQVKQSGEESTFSKICQILSHSTDYKTSVQLKGEEWADKSTLPMLGISAFILPVMGASNTAVFINSHIGNRIRIAAPLITLNQIAMTSEKGVLVKDGRALEGLAEVDVILFDKTGTLTTEVPKVKEIIVTDSYNEREILTFVAAAEKKFTHPIARAILEKAQEEHLSLPDIDEPSYKIGYGISVQIDNKFIMVGSSRFMTSEGLQLPEEIKTRQEDIYKKGNSLILVAVDKQVSGAIELQPQIRPEVGDIISNLKQRGIIEQIAVVSGDHMESTKMLARELGIDKYYYDILPENKAQIVEQLRAEGKTVCYVGDGINDAIAMKKANVSISIRGASTIATDIAEIVFMDGTIKHLCDLFDISESLNAKLKKSLIFTIIPGVVNLGGAFIFSYSILTSLLVSLSFGALSMREALLSLDRLPDRENPQLPSNEA